MRKYLLAAVLAATAVIAPASAQQGAATLPPGEVAPLNAEQQRNLERLRAAAAERNIGYDMLEDLVTEIGPRLAGSEAEERARQWAVQMLRENGFSNVRVEPVPIPFWDATREEAAIIGPIQQPMVIAALGGSGPTPAGGLEAEIVRFASVAELEAASPESVRGRIVYIDEHMTRDFGYGPAGVKRSRCAPLSREKGAVACLIRSVGTDTHRFAHQGWMLNQPPGTPIPAAALAPADADNLTRLVARGGPVRVRLNIETESRDGMSGNVIAEIPGRSRPSEIVLIAAHLDSWDLGQGAIDDGSGVAMITAAAKLIGDLPRRPRRTIRILLAGAEETGIHGGAAYGAAHEHETHILAAESDSGPGRVVSLTTGFGTDALPFARAMHRALEGQGVAAGGNTGGGGADIGEIRRRTGVPTIGVNPDNSDYFNYHHTANDTLYAVDAAEVQRNVGIWAQLIYIAADTDWDFRAGQPPTQR